MSTTDEIQRRLGELDRERMDLIVQLRDLELAAPASVKYEVGKRIRFPLAGHVYQITAVTEPDCTCEYPYEGAPQAGHHPNCAIGDPSQRGVTFARPDDPDDNCTETIADLERADVQVFAVATTGSDAR